MSDSASSDALTLLTFALDEMRETIALIPVADLSRSTTRSWWRNLFFAFARSRAEVGAGFAVQYLTENLERGRDHWHQGLSLLDQLQREHAESQAVAQLALRLQAAGLNEVMPRLRNEALPYSIDQVAAHLAAVVSTIRDCDRVALDARNQLTLQRLRNEQT